MEPAAQRELGLAPGQTRRLAAILERAETQVDVERAKPGAAARAISRRGWAVEMALPDLRTFGAELSPNQRVRLVQLTLRQAGPWVLEWPGAAEALGVSKETRGAIAEAQSRAAAEWQRKIGAYAKRHRIATFSMKGGARMPVETHAIRRLQEAEVGSLWAALRYRLTARQNARLAALLGRPPRFMGEGHPHLMEGK